MLTQAWYSRSLAENIIEYNDPRGIFQVPLEGLVNPVNCVGVAGRGLALAFRQRFPENHRAYAKLCNEGKIVPGKVMTFLYHGNAKPVIFNFPTKRHWRDKSEIEDICSGMPDLVRKIRGLEVKTVGIPALGCGLGGLSWKTVRPIILQHISDPSLQDITFSLFASELR